MSNFCGVITNNNNDKKNLSECMVTEIENNQFRFDDFELIVHHVAEASKAMQMEYDTKYQFIKDISENIHTDEQKLEAAAEMLQAISIQLGSVETELFLNEYDLNQIKLCVESLESQSAMNFQLCEEQQQKYAKCVEKVVFAAMVSLEGLISLAEDYAAEEKKQRIDNQGFCYLTQVLDCQQQVLENIEPKLDNLAVKVHNIDGILNNAAKEIYTK